MSFLILYLDELSGKLPMDIYIQLHQDHPCPPRLQEGTWRIGGDLMRFLMLDLDETFRKAYDGLYEYPDTITSSMSFDVFDLDETFRKAYDG